MDLENDHMEEDPTVGLVDLKSKSLDPHMKVQLNIYNFRTINFLSTKVT